MIAAGFIRPEDIEDEEAEDTADKKTSMVTRNRKKKKEVVADKQATEEPEEDDAKEEKKVIAEIKTEAAPVKKVEETPQEDEDVIEDWDQADIDDLTKNIAKKDILPAAGGKAIRLDEEDVDI